MCVCVSTLTFDLNSMSAFWHQGRTVAVAAVVKCPITKTAHSSEQSSVLPLSLEDAVTTCEFNRSDRRHPLAGCLPYRHPGVGDIGSCRTSPGSSHRSRRERIEWIFFLNSAPSHIFLYIVELNTICIQKREECVY